MKNKLSVVTMLLMLFISTVTIVLPAVPVNATDGVLNVLFDQDVAWAHVKVEEFANSVKWTIDLNEGSTYLNNPVAGIVVIIGIGNEIKFQVHNNDGVDSNYPYGTWLYSIYDGGWRTGTGGNNQPLPEGITATGGRSKSENPQMIFTVTIGKAYLANEFKWAVYFKGGSGGRTFYPTDFSWYDTNTSDMATAKYLILGGAIASIAKAKGTSEQYYWGSGCWAAVLGQKFEIYIDPTVPPFDVLGNFKIDDISSISYHTNKPGSQNDVDFYLVIYTKPDGVNDHGWYGYKLIGEPYFSRNLNAPSDQWNKWSTDVGTNQLTFFDPDTIGFYGFYGQPTLQDIQAGPINWHDYYSGCPVTNIDYGVEVVKYISFQTGTNWMNTFQGYIDAITIGLKDGTTVSIDLEGFAGEVWVDDDWTGLPPGYEVEPGKFIGYNAFAKIQDGINAVAPEGIVHVYPGTYVEQLVINKSLSLQGAVGAKIVAPNTRSTFTIPESTATWDPIIFAYGSISGYETIRVTIDGFEVDGGNKASSSYRYAGILCRNVKPGIISHNLIHRLYPPSGKGSGPQTFGIIVYGDSGMTIQNNEIRDFSRGGISISGDDGPRLDPVATVKENVVAGNGLETETGWWAENGIQIAWGAGGNVIGNIVSNCEVNNQYWVATGILIYSAAEEVGILSNIVANCDVGIAVASPSFDVIDGNTVTGCNWEGVRLGWPVNNVTVSNNILKENWAGIGVWDASDNKIQYNTIENNDYGIYMDGESNNNLIAHNKIVYNNVDGIHIEPYGGYDPSGAKVHYNCIVGNVGYGVYKEGSETVDATYNWWGDGTGPYHQTKNPSGLGDKVSDNVEFEPWLVAYFDYYRKNPVVNENVTFDASLTNKPCHPRIIISYKWNFNDGTGDIVETDPIIVHSFNAPGYYNVTLTITYDDSTTYTEWQMLYVSNKPYFKVEPEIVNIGLLNKEFKINVTINNVDINQRVIAVQFRIPYNATLLQFIDIAEGPFMKQAGNTLFMWYDEESVLFGRNLVVGIFIYPDENGTWHEFPEGSGLLATITFKAIYQERGLEKPPLACNLALCDTLIIDDEIQEVPHDIQNSVFQMYPTNIGDINYDGKVDVRDVARVAAAFGETPDRPRWDPICDINCDNKIDVKDVSLVARNFGWKSLYDP